MANDLRSEDSLKKKLQQVFKEAFAMWHKNGADCPYFPFHLLTSLLTLFIFLHDPLNILPAFSSKWS